MTSIGRTSPSTGFAGSHPAVRPAGRVGLRLVALMVIVSWLLVLPLAASAEKRYTPARKLGRASANITLGFLALPGQVTDTVRESGPFVGATWGLTKGVIAVAVTEVIGVFELLTTPFATPPGYEPIIRPEYPWQYFTEARDRDADR